MATIEDYVSGKGCKQIEQAFSIFGASKGSLRESEASHAMLNIVNKREDAMENIKKYGKAPNITSNSHYGFCLQAAMGVCFKTAPKLAGCSIARRCIFKI